MYEQHDMAPNSTPGITVVDEELGQAYELPKELEKLLKVDNLVEELDKTVLTTHYERLMSDIDYCETTMEHNIKRFKEANELAVGKPESSDKTFPFDGASRVMMPYLSQAALDFYARSMPALLERQNICQTQTFGELPPELNEAKDRVAQAINYDLAVGIDGWRDSQSKAMLQLPIGGNYYKKTWQDSQTDRRKSQLVQFDQVICDHTKQRFEECDLKAFRYTLSQNDVLTAIRTGMFDEFELSKDPEITEYELIECHCWLDLDDDDFAEPYIVTLYEEKEQVVSIVRRYDRDDIYTNGDNEVVRINAEEQFTHTGFIPDPGGTFVNWGWGTLVVDVFKTINTAIRQLLDAGTLQNIAGSSGFVSVGQSGGVKRNKKATFELTMGKFTAVETQGENIGQSVWQPTFAGPSPALLQLVEILKGDLADLVATGAIEANAGEAAELYLARLQQGLKLPNSIMINVYEGLSREFKRIYDVQKRYMSDYQYVIAVGPMGSKEADYVFDDLMIVTTADPTQGDQEERIAKAKIVLEEAKQNPAHDLRVAYTNYYESIGIDNAEMVLPEPQPQQPDPMVVMQQQAMQQMSEAEMMKARADLVSAQAKMLTAQLDMAKLDAEIDKLESETVKNLSQADKVELDTSIAQIKETRENFRMLIDDQRREVDQTAARIGLSAPRNTASS